MTGTPMFCRDCRWAQTFGREPEDRPSVISISRCLHPAAKIEAQPDIVTGMLVPAYQAFCSTARLFRGACGPGALLFEPRRNPEGDQP